MLFQLSLKCTGVVSFACDIFVLHVMCLKIGARFVEGCLSFVGWARSLYDSWWLVDLACRNIDAQNRVGLLSPCPERRKHTFCHVFEGWSLDEPYSLKEINSENLVIQPRVVHPAHQYPASSKGANTSMFSFSLDLHSLQLESFEESCP
jgi:hypothetical protein